MPTAKPKAPKTASKKPKATAKRKPADSAERLAAAAERIAQALENLQPQGATAAAVTKAPPAATTKAPPAARWHYDDKGGALLPLSPVDFDLSLLQGLDWQIKQVNNNVRAFMRGEPANHMLLSGPRGSGKSSLLRGVLTRHHKRGLRIIETDAAGLAQLPRLLPLLPPGRHAVCCDDLSFGRTVDLPLFQRLKSAIEGTLGGGANDILICATSNRRHLAAEFFSDNLAQFNDDINSGENSDETLSLSDRFGLQVPFLDLDDEAYLNVVRHWLAHYGIRPNKDHVQRARLWADHRGGRNGRAAHHFAVAVANGTAD